ncbi:MAG: 1-acyl-sn-glycerol-3-phosphate acyltransferase [FCB group bacterium]|nr:1-acyl-sn-glycerol-3-phosphate acyltransferase [FCB group bacterium]
MMILKYLRTAYIYVHVYFGNFFFGGLVIFCSFFIRKISFFNGIITAWGKWATLPLPGRCTVRGHENIEKGNSYVIISNHESTVDVFFLLAKLRIPMRIVAKIELEKSFVLGKAMDRSGFIFVDNKVKGKSIDHLNERFELLKKEGISLMVFPEGSRFKDQLLSPFRSGAFVIAIKHNLPILPVVMKGPREMMPPDKKSFSRSNIEMEILPPIDTDSYTYEDRHALMELCYKQMHDQLKKMHA